jgi:hypothetical protein
MASSVVSASETRVGRSVKSFVNSNAYINTPRRPETTGRMLSVVAGGRYARVSRLPGPLALPVEGLITDAA